MTKGKTIHLRHDTKAHEQRTPLTPAGVKQLLAAGYTVKVEKYVTGTTRTRLPSYQNIEVNFWQTLA